VSRASVVVVGGGIAGLAAAWELSGGAEGPNERTPRVEVIEASDRFGGTLATTEFADRLIDLGADGFLARRPEATTLVQELGINDQLVAINSSGASLWSRGALHELPKGLVLGVPTDMKSLRHFKGITWRGRVAARRDLFFPRRLTIGEDVTIGAILRHKLGRELTYQLIEPMIGGIQAGRIDELSAKSVFPGLYEAAQHGGSLMKALRNAQPTPGPKSETVAGPVIFYSLQQGVGSLVSELVRQLKDRGVVLRHSVAVTALRRTPAGNYPWEVDTLNTTTPANAIVLATPAPVVGALLGLHDAALDALRNVRSAGASIITFEVPQGSVTLPSHGTGILVPLGTSWSNEGSLMVTAITLLDRKWPHLKREGSILLRAHVGRSDDERWVAMTDDELVSRVTSELKEILGKFEKTSASHVQRWPNGLPQYVLGHGALVARARRAAAPLSVALCGNAYDGVGVPASIGSGRDAGVITLNSLEPDSAA
jgi:oxygen-dependent protoporphyrinogen oxidase